MTELYFKGKEFVYNHHLAVPHRPLVPDADKGIGAPDLSGNLIIQGDNLHALKSLLPTHAGRIDCIFIDPPYNTGNQEWCYNDRVNAPMIRDWLDENPVGVEDGLRHDKWCAMMWPRLKLLHELLAETGSFWMTLDDNEVHRGRMLVEDVFSEENFIAEICWQSRKSNQNDAKVSVSHNTIFCFAKQIGSVRLNSFSVKADEYSNPDDDSRGAWKSVPFDAPNIRENLTYEIINPATGQRHLPPRGRCWRTTEEKYLEMLATGQIIFGKTGRARPQAKRYLIDAEEAGRVPNTWWDDAGTATEATKELQAIFEGVSPFDTPKPTRLISDVIALASDQNSLILDSFAGSGTTAHAVLKANAEDGGTRKFILVEMEDDIADPVTAERVRRVINGYDHDGKSTAGLGGGFTFCTLGDPIDLDRILTGDDLPEWDALAPVLYHMATSRTLDPASPRPGDHYVGAAGDEHVWMIYRPDLDWLKSDAAALTLTRARDIQETAPDKRHLVFAPARFVSETVLRDHGLNVAYVPFPNALYQIAREG